MNALYTSRRGFLLGTAGVATALTLGVSRQASAAAGSFSPNVFVRLESDGSLFLTCNRSEMGQGVRSSIPALIADELGADLGRIHVVQATGDTVYGDQNTDGSTSIRTQYDMLRRMGAVARTLLVQAAATQLGVDPSGLTTQDHHVVGGDVPIPFGDLAVAAAALTLPDPDDVVLRPESELVHMGTNLPLVDALAFVTGAAQYGADVTLPGMVTAVIARPPQLGGQVSQYDDTAARAIPGVIDVIEMPRWSAPGRFHPLGGIAVVAEHTWAAIQGRNALRISWEDGPHAGIDSASEYDAMTEAVNTPGNKRRATGKADDVLESATRTVSATYRVPHLVHAPMEPPAAIAWRKDDSCEVWAPVQAPQRTRNWVKKVVGLPKDNITVNVTFLGAAFGRKGKPDFAVEAAFLSNKLRVPVRVQWTREDDIQHSFYHACAVQRLDGALDDAGNVTAWRQRIASPSILTTYLPVFHGLLNLELGMGVLDLPLDIPNVSMETHSTKEHVRIGWLRSVYNINHAFAAQCFVDELAAEARIPTPDMLKKIIGPPRALTSDETGAPIPNYGRDLDEHPVDVGRWHRVIDRVREMSGYDVDTDDASAMGFAAHASFNTYVAVVVRVSRDPRGGPKLEEAWVVADPGRVINRDRVIAQLEGGFVFGATIALYGNVTLKDGAVEQTNFRDYRLLRMHECPRHIHTELITEGEAPGGVGEPGVPPVAPAIANAWFALSGERVRELPFRPGMLPT